MDSEPRDDFGMSGPAVRFAQDAMLIGTPDGRIVHANPAACAMFGRSVDELRRGGGRALIDHITPASEAAWAGRLQTGSFHGEIVCRRPDGSLFETETSGQIFAGDDGHQYTSISIRDITARRAVEAALAKSEQHYRALIETLDEGVVYQDGDGAILASNPAAERILGLTAEQMAGRTSLDPRWRSVHEDGTPFPGHDHPAMVSLRTDQPASAIMGVHKPDGMLTWISIRARPVREPGDGAPTGVVATFTDITEERAARVERERLTCELTDRLRSRTVLLEVAEQIAQETDADDLRAALAAHATAISGADVCAFLRWDAEERTLTTISSTSPDMPVGRVHAGLSGPLPFGLAGLAIEQQQPVVVDDYAVALAHQPDADGHRLGARAAAAVPLQYGGRTLGVLMVWSTRPDVTFGAPVMDNLRLLGGLASAAFVGLERTQLAAIALSARAIMHAVNNHLAIAAGTLDVGLNLDRLSPDERAALVEVNAELDAAAEQLAMLARVSRVQTVATPMGPALDLDASIE